MRIYFQFRRGEEAAGQKSANEYADTYEQEDVLKFDESTEVSDKLHNINNDEYTDLETKIVEKAESFESEKNAKADFEIF